MADTINIMTIIPTGSTGGRSEITKGVNVSTLGPRDLKVNKYLGSKSVCGNNDIE